VFLCLSKHHEMKAYWVSGGLAPPILNLGTDGGGLSASCTGLFAPGVTTPVPIG